MSIASEITRIAGLRDGIRSKLIDFGIITDTSAKLTDCATAIEGIDEATLTIPSLSIASNPTIDSSTGLVSVSGSASGTVSASKGYSKGLIQSISVPVSGSLQLTTQAAQTITPGTSNKTIAANRWLTGAQTIKGDSNLIAANIASGKSIFGVSGSAVNAGNFSTTSTKYAVSSVGTYDSTAQTWTFTIPLGTAKPYFVYISPHSEGYTIGAGTIGPPTNNTLIFYVFGDYSYSGSAGTTYHTLYPSTTTGKINGTSLTITINNRSNSFMGEHSDIYVIVQHF